MTNKLSTGTEHSPGNEILERPSPLQSLLAPEQELPFTSEMLRNLTIPQACKMFDIDVDTPWNLMPVRIQDHYRAGVWVFNSKRTGYYFLTLEEIENNDHQRMKPEINFEDAHFPNFASGGVIPPVKGKNKFRLTGEDGAEVILPAKD